MTFESSDDAKRNLAYQRKETEKPMKKWGANRKTAPVFTSKTQTAGNLLNGKTAEKLSKNRKTAHKKIPKPQNRKQVDPPIIAI